MSLLASGLPRCQEKGAAAGEVLTLAGWSGGSWCLSSGHDVELAQWIGRGII